MLTFVLLTTGGKVSLYFKLNWEGERKNKTILMVSVNHFIKSVYCYVKYCDLKIKSCIFQCGNLKKVVFCFYYFDKMKVAYKFVTNWKKNCQVFTVKFITYEIVSKKAS